MVFALATTAFATDDEVEPCASCDHNVQHIATPLDQGHYVRADACPYNSTVHNHFVRKYNYMGKCLKCGAVTYNYNENIVICPHQ